MVFGAYWTQVGPKFCSREQVISGLPNILPIVPTSFGLFAISVVVRVQTGTPRRVAPLKS